MSLFSAHSTFSFELSMGPRNLEICFIMVERLTIIEIGGRMTETTGFINEFLSELFFMDRVMATDAKVLLSGWEFIDFLAIAFMAFFTRLFLMGTS